MKVGKLLEAYSMFQDFSHLCFLVISPISWKVRGKDMRSEEALHICLLLREAYIYTLTSRYVILTLVNMKT